MENLKGIENSANKERPGYLDKNAYIFTESVMDSMFCGFYWIRNSGIPYFKWFSTEYFNMKWNQDDLFFSGFFSALNSSGEVFFDGDILHYVEFEEYKIYSGKIQSDDIFILITTKSAPDSLANQLLHNMLHYYMESTISHKIEQDNGDVEETFLRFLQEISNEVKISGTKPKLSKQSAYTQSKINKPSRPLLFTEKQEFKKRIVELELKLNALSMMSRSIGHNLNNVLSAILGNISLAQMDSPQGSEQSECLGDAELSCKRVRSLTHKLLTIAKNLSRNIDTEQSQNTTNLKKWQDVIPSEDIVMGSGRILVMDDEASIRNTAKKMLVRIGYEVDVAENLEVSLRKYEESMKEQKYDAVILDLTELGELGAFGALIWLKMDPSINAIVSSGFAQDPIFDQYESHGFRGVLRKPYDIRRLSQVLHDVISNS